MARRKPQPKQDLSRWAPLLVAAVTLIVFLPSVANDFVNWDDDVNFLQNADYRGLARENVSWAFRAFLLGHYHPLTWLSSSLDYALWGMNPAGYHFTNALFHAVAAGIACLLFLELPRKALPNIKPERLAWASAVAALVFSLHPLRVESVAWASERRDVLYGVFYCLTLLLYVRGRIVWALAAFTAALMSKILAVTLPPVLLLIDFYPLRRRFDHKLLLRKIPFFVLAFAFGWYALTRTTGGVVGATADIGLYPDVRLALTLYGLAFYLWKTVLPFGLYPQYVYSLEPQLTDARILLSALVVVALTIVALLQLKKRPWIAVIWGSYVLMLAPVLSLIRLDVQQAVADHNSYLATLGVACLLGAFWAKLRENPGNVAVISAVAVLILLAGLTLRQIPRWSDSKTLWTYTTEGQPLAIVAHNNLGRALADEGDIDGAIASIERAVDLQPEYAQAQYNLGSLRMQRGDLAAAEVALRASVAKEPRFAPAQNALANCLLRQGRAQEAVERYEAALLVAPAYADAHYNFAVALESLGLYSQAVEHYQAAFSLDRSNGDAAAALDRLRRVPR